MGKLEGEGVAGGTGGERPARSVVPMASSSSSSLTPMTTCLSRREELLDCLHTSLPALPPPPPSAPPADGPGPLPSQLLSLSQQPHRPEADEEEQLFSAAGSRPANSSSALAAGGLLGKTGPLYILHYTKETARRAWLEALLERNKMGADEVRWLDGFDREKLTRQAAACLFTPDYDPFRRQSSRRQPGGAEQLLPAVDWHGPAGAWAQFALYAMMLREGLSHVLVMEDDPVFPTREAEGRFRAALAEMMSSWAQLSAAGQLPRRGRFDVIHFGGLLPHPRHPARRGPFLAARDAARVGEPVQPLQQRVRDLAGGRPEDAGGVPEAGRPGRPGADPHQPGLHVQPRRRAASPGVRASGGVLPGAPALRQPLESALDGEEGRGGCSRQQQQRRWGGGGCCCWCFSSSSSSSFFSSCSSSSFF